MQQPELQAKSSLKKKNDRDLETEVKVYDKIRR